MTCLLLRLAGPMQSWGTRSRFTERDTEREPTKSGLIGLCCAALGIDREEDDLLRPLAVLKTGVRADREGAVRVDYHTAGGGAFRGQSYGVIKASGAPGDAVVSHRYYLADAEFHAALEGPGDLLEKIEAALRNPRWPLFLGRKAFLPDPPLCLGLREEGTEQALAAVPWRRRSKWEKVPERLRLTLECNSGEGAARMDVPLSFALARRRFAVRFVRHSYLTDFPVEEGQACISHD